MKRIGIIGLGVISANYKKALLASPHFQLVAVSDVNERAKSRDLYREYPFYTDYQGMIQKETLDFVLIATPPSTHYDIAKTCLHLHTNIVMEKPAVLDLGKYDELLAIAKAKQLVFEVMYHFQNGSETLAFIKDFDPKKITRIRVDIQDGYSADGIHIMPDRQILQGAWLDSGVNALSQIKLFLPCKDVRLIERERVLCPDCRLPIYVYVRLTVDGVPVEITIDWRKNVNSKITTLTYDGRALILHNTDQSIVHNGEVTCYATMPRLEAHYYNYFQQFKGESDEAGSRRIHEILLDVHAHL